MKEADIQEEFKKANWRLMTSLDQDEKREAIEEFKALYDQEMGKVKVKTEKAQKIQKNLEEKHIQEENTKRQIQSSLKERMEMHFKKRENYQLQKIKNYRRIQVQWRDKLKAIGNQMKQREKQNFLHSNRLSKEALMFWQSRQEKKRASANKRQQSKYFSHDHTPNLLNGGETGFLTQANINININQRKGVEARDYNFPSLQRCSRLRTEGSGSKSVAVDRHKSDLIREHLLKSSDLWREKDNSNFQRVMHKLEHIQKTRNKARKMIAQESERIRRSRMQRDASQEQRFFKAKREAQRYEERGSSSFSIHKPNRELKSGIEREFQSSKVQKRRSQLLDTEFRDRSSHFQFELKKQHKGGYRKMVKDAVQSLKLQALKLPS